MPAGGVLPQDFPCGGNLEPLRNGLPGFAARDRLWHKARKIAHLTRVTTAFDRRKLNQMEPAPARRPRVLIVGAGFGGLEAAKKLACEEVKVTVVDRTNHHLFQPLLYQVATAALSPADIAAPVRGILSECRNMEVILAEVQSVDVAAKMVKTGELELAYDYLILATGARHSYFGHPEWEPLAPGLKSLEDAVEIRRRILLAFEYAEKISA